MTSSTTCIPSYGDCNPTASCCSFPYFVCNVPNPSFAHCQLLHDIQTGSGFDCVESWNICLVHGKPCCSRTEECIAFANNGACPNLRPPPLLRSPPVHPPPVHTTLEGPASPPSNPPPWLPPETPPSFPESTECIQLVSRMCPALPTDVISENCVCPVHPHV